MTWYWWTHWFWITSISTTVFCQPTGSIDVQITKQNVEKLNKDESLNINQRDSIKFSSINVDMLIDNGESDDTDDIMDGHQMFANLQQSMINQHTKWTEKLQQIYQRNYDQINQLHSNLSSDKELYLNNNSNDKSSNGSMQSIDKPYVIDKHKLNISKSQQNDLNHNVSESVNTSREPIDDQFKLNILPLNKTSININLTVTESSKELNQSTDVLDELDQNVSESIKIDDTYASIRNRKSKLLTEYESINLTESKYKNFQARSTLGSSLNSIEDTPPEALSINRSIMLNTGAISGICVSAVFIVIASSLAGVALYRWRFRNSPQTLSEPDSSAYIDDTTLRENSDEMYSLDNDSFLNSLEAMTIQNYWTDTIRHTKL